MLLLSHVFIALIGMGVAAAAYVLPSQIKLYGAYGFAVATLATGTALLLGSPSHLVPACISGLLYFGVVGAVIFAARAKLATETVLSESTRK